MQDRVVLQAKDATVLEVPDALRRAIGLEVTLRGTVEQKFTGVYSGSVHFVITRLLSGENYILRTTSSGMSTVLLGQSMSDDEVSGPVCSLYSGHTTKFHMPLRRHELSEDKNV